MIALRNHRLTSWTACFFLALIFIALAFRVGWRATHDLDWPYDYDFYRDAAIAQTILDGRFPADPFYAGEENWYNPLAPALVAGFARLFDLPPAQVYARHGAVIGLAIPCAFFLLAVVLLGRWGGLAALFALLFLGVNDVAVWAAPSYSPWLFANLVSVVPFAFTLMLALRAHRTRDWRAWSGCGVLLGVTFLAHTAAAVMAGCVVLVLAFDPRNLRATAMRWAIVLILALVASAPLAITILGHYRLVMPHPLEFVSDETRLDRLGPFLKGALNLGNAVALGGFVALVRRRTVPGVRSIVITWLSVAVLMLASGYARQAWPSVKLPGLVPSFHWLFHLRLLRSLLLGYGLFSGIEAVVSRLPRGGEIRAPVALSASLAVLLLLNYGAFTQRYDFTVARDLSQRFAAIPGFAETVNWLRRETPPDAIILATANDGLLVIGAAGRRTVFIEQVFSNPYVPYEPRATAAGEMAESLVHHERESFLAAASRYHVTYVLLNNVSPVFSERCLAAPFVTKRFAQGYYAVVKIER